MLTCIVEGETICGAVGAYPGGNSMTKIRKIPWIAIGLVFWGVAMPLLHAQDSATTIQLPDGTTAQLTFTTIDVPGAASTSIGGINSGGDIVGSYSTTPNGPAHGFLLKGGNFTYFDYPGVQSTFALGINDSGLIVGFTSGGVRELGFTYDGTAFTTIRAGKNSATSLMGINSAGYLVGGAGTIYDSRAIESRDSRFKVINFPGIYVYGYATGINKAGQVVGWTSSGSETHSYLYDQGTFTLIDVPGAAGSTEAWEINDTGMIVGWYSIDGPADYGFALLNGQYVSFSYPGAHTFASGINALGQIVGSYTFDYLTYHGFVTSAVTSTQKADRRAILPSNRMRHEGELAGRCVRE